MLIGTSTPKIQIVSLGWVMMRVRVLRLELKLAMHGAQLVLAIATSVLVSRYGYRGADIQADWMALVVFIIIVAVFSALGIIWQKRQFEKKYLKTNGS